MLAIKEKPKASPVNYVGVKPFKKKSHKLGDIEIAIPNMFDQRSLRAVEGEVVSLPKKVQLGVFSLLRRGLLEDETKFPEKLPIITDLQLEVGDVIGYHHLDVQTDELSDDDYIMVDYNRVFYKRDENGITPIDGWILCEEIQQEWTTPSGIYLTSTPTYEKGRYKVISVFPGCEDIEPGDVVLPVKGAGVPAWVKGEKKIRIEYNQVLAKCE